MLKVNDLFYSSVIKGVLSAAEHHGGGEETPGEEENVANREE